MEQLISDIRDPNLDCSLDDIAAMIDSKDDKIEKEKIRGSPEFATAATMIDKVWKNKNEEFTLLKNGLCLRITTKL